MTGETPPGFPEPEPFFDFEPPNPSDVSLGLEPVAPFEEDGLDGECTEGLESLILAWPAAREDTEEG